MNTRFSAQTTRLPVTIGVPGDLGSPMHIGSGVGSTAAPSIRESDAKFRTLAETTASAIFICWGERLLLRIADRELNRMKSRRGPTYSPLYDCTGEFGSLEGCFENRP